ncbi:GAF domain-containing protein [Crenobacter cavernae]|uniref:GAF domain-containing protein n=1 Tax=Crenobacter cavernae TaxID=2290923 RepID=A0ABY0FAE4_9NEIS|nr:GAF domain-containing protein [Crenobacter cavernae]RXZ42623.1 GAF domain-containing protein [Crenobacter cavernae]
MAESLLVDGNSKDERYRTLLPQARALITGETDLVAALANLAAALNTTFPRLWTGFYLVKGEQLVLGPFQGPIACTRIPYGRGVCGAAWKENRTLVVPDVDTFPGHIACSSSTRSEIVVPVRDADGRVVAVLDIDADTPSAFDETDAVHLERLVKTLAPLF